jgi:hypothetical protein
MNTAEGGGRLALDYEMVFACLRLGFGDRIPRSRCRVMRSLGFVFEVGGQRT